MNGSEPSNRPFHRLLRRPLGLPIFEFFLGFLIVVGILVAFIVLIMSRLM
jgi:hypothetical protein